MGVSKDIVTVKDRVEYLLENYPETRDDDAKLWISYMTVFYDLRSVIGDSAWAQLKEIIYSSESYESLRRVRQKTQEGGKFLGTKRKKRLQEEAEFRDWAKKSAADTLGV